MPIHHSIAALARLADQPALDDPGVATRQLARAACARHLVAALQQAHARADKARDRFYEAHPEYLDDDHDGALADLPEEQVVEAILAQIAAIRDHDRWPAALYWSL
jgi:hypothetical protein